ncbi:hypothetical protein SESBI_16039 [Sesbania bispinosa]|nr:hypothetical protein SESBI_16039 [Sesbania bispinosa]
MARKGNPISEGYTLYMEDPAGGEGGSGAGSSQRPVDLNLPPGSGDELSDLVAELDQVEREIRRLSESRIESGLEATQERLARLKTVLDEIENWLEQARQMDAARDQEQARQRAKLHSQMEPFAQRLAARRQALEGVQNTL